jgi:hypothetical protein
LKDNPGVELSGLGVGFRKERGQKPILHLEDARQFIREFTGIK